MALLVAAPLFRQSLNAEGYLLSCQCTRQSVLDVIAEVGIQPIAANKPLLVPLDKFDVQQRPRLEEYGNVRQLMPLLGPDVPLRMASALQQQGFHVSVHGKSPQSLVCADYWLMDEDSMADPHRQSAIARLRTEKFVTAVATGINDWGEFEQALVDGFELFEGRFYVSPSGLPSHKELAPVKANLVRLLNVVRNDDYEFSTVTNVVRQDPALTVSLMRFINSPYIGVRNRVRSIQQAVTLLGQDQVRKWVTAALYKSLATDKPSELTRLSLCRAMFAERLAPLFRLQPFEDSMFLTGLFSVLDVILGLPMQKALELVPVDRDIESALLDRTGPYAPLVTFMLNYELANWHAVYEQMDRYKLKDTQVLKAYLDSVGWYSDLTLSAKPDNVTSVNF